MTRDEIVSRITAALYGRTPSQIAANTAAGGVQPTLEPKLHYCTVKIGNYEVNIDRIPSTKMSMEGKYVVAITSNNHIVASMPSPTEVMSEVMNFAADKLIEIESEVDKLLVDTNDKSKINGD